MNPQVPEEKCFSTDQLYKSAQSTNSSTISSNEKPVLKTPPSSDSKLFRSISVILPAFNEEANVERAATSAFDVFSRYFEKIEIIVVDDGSTDATKVRLFDVVDKIPEVLPRCHEVNRGYGAALRTGIDAASNELIFFTDSDLQFDLNEVERLLEWTDSHDIVAGYRAHRADPPIRKLNAWGWNMLVRMVLGVKVRDIDCAFKIFHRRVFDDINLESVGAMINTEILARALHAKMTIKEVPVSHFKREEGEQTGANFRVIVKAFKELFQMRGKLSRKKSNK